jgi:hypothetical protein
VIWDGITEEERSIVIQGLTNWIVYLIRLLPIVERLSSSIGEQNYQTE